MGWRKDKKFWYYGVSLKSQIFKEGLPKKTKYRGGLLKGEGLGQFADLRYSNARYDDKVISNNVCKIDFILFNIFGGFVFQF